MGRRPISNAAMTPAMRMSRMRARNRAELEAIERARPELNPLPALTVVAPGPAPQTAQPTGVHRSEAAQPVPPSPNGTSAPEPLHQPPAPEVACKPTPPAIDLLAGSAEAIATRLLERLPLEICRGIALALQQKLLAGGSWPMWRPPIIS